MGGYKQFEIEHNEQQMEKYQELNEKNLPEQIQNIEGEISNIKKSIHSLADDIIDNESDDWKDYFSNIDDEKERLIELQKELRILEDDLEELIAIKKDLDI